MRLVRFERAQWVEVGQDPAEKDWGPAYVNPAMVVFIDGAPYGPEVTRIGMAHAENMLWIAKRAGDVAFKLSDEIKAGG